MHRCEFCNTCFQSRPQVKHPRACQNCQKQRQRGNEKTWHFKHKTNFDRKYHAIQKAQRLGSIKSVSVNICHWIKTGALFYGNSFLNSDWENSFLVFLVGLGIRKVNKFWSLQLVHDFTNLS